MTVEELVELTEGLLHSTGLDLKQLRDHGAPAMAEDLTDDQFLLAVRFLAGERPVIVAGGFEPLRPEKADLVQQPRRQRRLISLDEDEAARRLAALEALDEDTPFDLLDDDVPAYTGPVDIGDGVTLGL